MRAQVLHPHSGPTALITHVNRLVQQSFPTHFYGSLFYAEFDSSTRVLEYINAGHNPPLIVRSGEGGSTASTRGRTPWNIHEFSSLSNVLST
jgi:sigma-B regulation protein RsbU (phosphoserine phosphatase)